MKQDTWETKAQAIDSPVRKAIALLGGQIKASKALGVSQMAVCHWCNREIPIERAIQVSRAVHFAVPYQAMRPDVDWGPPVAVYVAAPTAEELARSTGT